MRTIIRAARRAVIPMGMMLAIVAVFGTDFFDDIAAAQSPGPAPVRAMLPSCDPRILHSPFGSGPTQASGAGVAAAPVIRLTDTDGAPLPNSSGSISWSFAAEVRDSPERPRFSHDIGGYLNLDITTTAGHQISFRAHCIAGAGTFRVPPSLSTDGYTLLYANGTVSGWPPPEGSPRQGAGARRAFVHFEAIRLLNGQVEIYIAVVDGEDCALNFNTLIVTEPPDFPVGGGSYSATNRTSYTETNCALLGGPGRSFPQGPRRPIATP